MIRRRRQRHAPNLHRLIFLSQGPPGQFPPFQFPAPIHQLHTPIPQGPHNHLAPHQIQGLVLPPVDTNGRHKPPSSRLTTRSSSQLNTSSRLRGTARCTSTGLAATRANHRWNAGKYSPSKNRLALSRSLIPARRISLTSRSCSTPFIRSTRPLACGLFASFNSTPNGSIARPNCVWAAFPSSCSARLSPPLRNDRCCPRPPTACAAGRAGAPNPASKGTFLSSYHGDILMEFRHKHFVQLNLPVASAILSSL
jgi:hypothetical protein